MFKNKTTDDSSILKFAAVLCMFLFLMAGNVISEDDLKLGTVIIGFGIFSSSLLIWMSKKI